MAIVYIHESCSGKYAELSDLVICQFRCQQLQDSRYSDAHHEHDHVDKWLAKH